MEVSQSVSRWPTEIDEERTPGIRPRQETGGALPPPFDGRVDGGLVDGGWVDAVVSASLPLLPSFTPDRLASLGWALAVLSWREGTGVSGNNSDKSARPARVGRRGGLRPDIGSRRGGVSPPATTATVKPPPMTATGRPSAPPRKPPVEWLHEWLVCCRSASVDGVHSQTVCSSLTDSGLLQVRTQAAGRARPRDGGLGISLPQAQTRAYLVGGLRQGGRQEDGVLRSAGERGSVQCGPPLCLSSILVKTLPTAFEAVTSPSLLTGGMGGRRPFSDCVFFSN